MSILKTAALFPLIILIFFLNMTISPLFSNPQGVSDTPALRYTPEPPSNFSRIVDSMPFTDIPLDAWYLDAAIFVTNRGLFKGTSETTFAPNDTMTRGMFVTALGRYANFVGYSPESTIAVVTSAQVNMRSGPDISFPILAVLYLNTSVEILGISGNWYNVRYMEHTGYIRSDLLSLTNSTFTDVPADSYYASYIDWGTSKAIIEGTTSITFSPEQYITRETISDALYNYAKSANMRLEPKYAPIEFSDDADIQYKESVYALQRAGIINGRTGNIFDPLAYATRAEVAAIFERFNNVVRYDPEPIPSYPPDGAYIFGTALPESSEVPDEYFNDAAFLGHSFVYGMQINSVLSNASFYGINGVSAAEYQTHLFPVLDEESGLPRYVSISDALASQGYGKVYLFFGVNELGPEEYHRNKFADNMSSIIATVQDSLPDATIYLISIAPVTRSCSHNSTNYNRDNIIAFNNVLKMLSAEHNAIYLDIFSFFCDDDGYLPDADALSDGLHLLDYSRLKDFLNRHTY